MTVIYACIIIIIIIGRGLLCCCPPLMKHILPPCLPPYCCVRFDAKLKNEEETAQSLMQQHSVMTKTQETLYKDSQQQKAEIRRLQDKEARLRFKVRLLQALDSLATKSCDK